MIKIEERYTFKKEERVNGDKRVEAIFTTGKSFISYPLRVVYLLHEQCTLNGCSILVSVPKKRIKKAVHRNRIKRLIRESYRLNRYLISKTGNSDITIDIAFVYVKDTVSNYVEIEKAIQKALNQIVVRINKTEVSE